MLAVPDKIVIAFFTAVVIAQNAAIIVLFYRLCEIMQKIPNCPCK